MRKTVVTASESGLCVQSERQANRVSDERFEMLCEAIWKGAAVLAIGTLCVTGVVKCGVFALMLEIVAGIIGAGLYFGITD